MKRMRLSLLAVLVFLPLRLAAFPTMVTNCQPLTSGVYVLNADVFAAANSPCFTMTANNITLTLNGHTVFGSAGVAAITDGGVARRGISVSSGTMVVDNGIDLFASSEVRIESLNVDAAGTAIAVGPFSKVLGNLVTVQGSTGIKVQCPTLLVWNNVFVGLLNIVEVGKGCVEVNNTSTKK